MLKCLDSLSALWYLYVIFPEFIHCVNRVCIEQLLHYFDYSSEEEIKSESVILI